MNKNALKSPQPATSGRAEEERLVRVMDCYRRPGGPLLALLADEAKRLGQTRSAMSAALGVTGSYIYQLRTGHRKMAHISDTFVGACARYLRVPPIVVKLLAGRVSVADFWSPEMSEEEVIERGFRHMLNDPAVRDLLPLDAENLPTGARKALVLLYAENTRTDLFGARELPTMLRYLQQAAMVHEENLMQASQATSLTT